MKIVSMVRYIKYAMYASVLLLPFVVIQNAGGASLLRSSYDYREVPDPRCPSGTASQCGFYGNECSVQSYSCLILGS